MMIKMNDNKNDWGDKRLEIVLGNLLRWGVIISSVTVLAGGVVYLVKNGGNAPHYHTFRGLVNPFHSLGQVIHGTLQGDGQAIIQLGVVLLIATPVARIIFSIIGFAKEKDRLYIAIASIVLAIILTGVLSGIKA